MEVFESEAFLALDESHLEIWPSLPVFVAVEQQSVVTRLVGVNVERKCAIAAATAPPRKDRVYIVATFEAGAASLW